VSYLPAPYESAQQDDLPAALGAGLAVVLAGITSWILGQRVVDGARTLIDLGRARPGADLPKGLLVPTAGWGVAVVLMVIGCLSLIFRRGRGALIFGALVSVATTALARYSFHWATPGQPVAQWALYWGGLAVVVAAALPATRRWIRRAQGAASGFPVNASYQPPR
jgi:hypothetical protein